MIQRITTVVIAGLILSCNKGLEPTGVEQPPIVLDFPVTPQGGNPVGNWISASESPAEVTLLNPEKIPPVVDSLILKTQLAGSFIISLDKSYDIDAQLEIAPYVYLMGSPNPLVIDPIVDTLKGSGRYEILEDQALVFDFGETIFQLDTLGFTAREDTLWLISLPNIFPYPGFGDIKFFFIFNLTRTSGEISLWYFQENGYLRKRERFK
jgi:hypothetical protein